MIGARRGIPTEDMYQYLVQQESLNGLAPRIAAAAGPRFAGVWVDWRPEPVLVVSITGAEGMPLVAHVAGVDGAVEVRYGARHARAALERGLEAALRRGEAATGTLASGYVDDEHNRVVVTVPHDRATLARGERAREGFVEILETLDVAYLVEVEAGAAQLENRGGRYLRNCTSGFVVRGASGQAGYLTAGHCPPDQDYKWWSDGIYRDVELAVSGSAREVWSASVDVQWHGHIARNQAFEPLFHDSRTTVRRQTGIASYSQGSELCKWGTRSEKIACGPDISTTWQPSGNCGSVAGVRCARTYVAIDLGTGVRLSCEGDSGGPWFIGGNAAGVHTGSRPYYTDGQTCSGGYAYDRTTAYFVPISTALGALNVALLK